MLLARPIKCTYKVVGVERIELPRVLATRFQSETAAKLRNYTPIKLVGGEGFEPSQTLSESAVLPITLASN